MLNIQPVVWILPTKLEHPASSFDRRPCWGSSQASGRWRPLTLKPKQYCRKEPSITSTWWLMQERNHVAGPLPSVLLGLQHHCSNPGVWLPVGQKSGVPLGLQHHNSDWLAGASAAPWEEAWHHDLMLWLPPSTCNAWLLPAVSQTSWSDHWGVGTAWGVGGEGVPWVLCSLWGQPHTIQPHYELVPHPSSGSWGFKLFHSALTHHTFSQPSLVQQWLPYHSNFPHKIMYMVNVY